MKRCAALLIMPLFAACVATSEPAALGRSVATELRVLTYNVKHGLGNDGVVDIARAGEVIRRTGADLVVLQEIDCEAKRSGQLDQMALLAEHTGLEMRFGAFMPYQGGEYGMGLLSRFPILASANHRLPDGAEPRTALDARVRLPNGDELLLCGVHLYRTEEQRLAQARELVRVYEDVDVPVVLAGDFNSEPGGTVMGEIEHHWNRTDKGLDHLTCPTDAPESEIDFVLYRPKDRFEVVSLDVLEEPVVSDHRPVLMVVRLLPGVDLLRAQQ